MPTAETPAQLSIYLSDWHMFSLVVLASIFFRDKTGCTEKRY